MYRAALRVGMNKKEFYHSTPNDILSRIDIHNENQEYRIKEIEYQAWISGIFVKAAIASSFDKKYKYPENPIAERSKSPKEIAKRSGKTEEQLKQEEAYAVLLVKKANANIAKNRQKLKEKQGEQVS